MKKLIFISLLFAGLFGCQTLYAMDGAEPVHVDEETYTLEEAKDEYAKQAEEEQKLDAERDKLEKREDLDKQEQERLRELQQNLEAYKDNLDQTKKDLKQAEDVKDTDIGKKRLEDASKGLNEAKKQLSSLEKVEGELTDSLQDKDTKFKREKLIDDMLKYGKEIGLDPKPIDENMTKAQKKPFKILNKLRETLKSISSWTGEKLKKAPAAFIDALKKFFKDFGDALDNLRGKKALSKEAMNELHEAMAETDSLNDDLFDIDPELEELKESANEKLSELSKNEPPKKHVIEHRKDEAKAFVKVFDELIKSDNFTKLSPDSQADVRELKETLEKSKNDPTKNDLLASQDKLEKLSQEIKNFENLQTPSDSDTEQLEFDLISARFEALEGRDKLSRKQEAEYNEDVSHKSLESIRRDVNELELQENLEDMDGASNIRLRSEILSEMKDAGSEVESNDLRTFVKDLLSTIRLEEGTVPLTLDEVDRFKQNIDTVMQERDASETAEEKSAFKEAAEQLKVDIESFKDRKHASPGEPAHEPVKQSTLNKLEAELKKTEHLEADDSFDVSEENYDDIDEVYGLIDESHLINGEPSPLGPSEEAMQKVAKWLKEVIKDPINEKIQQNFSQAIIDAQMSQNDTGFSPNDSLKEHSGEVVELSKDAKFEPKTVAQQQLEADLNESGNSKAAKILNKITKPFRDIASHKDQFPSAKELANTLKEQVLSLRSKLSDKLTELKESLDASKHKRSIKYRKALSEIRDNLFVLKAKLGRFADRLGSLFGRENANFSQAKLDSVSVDLKSEMLKNKYLDSDAKKYVEKGSIVEMRKGFDARYRVVDALRERGITIDVVKDFEEKVWGSFPQDKITEVRESLEAYYARDGEFYTKNPPGSDETHITEIQELIAMKTVDSKSILTRDTSGRLAVNEEVLTDHLNWAWDNARKIKPGKLEAVEDLFGLEVREHRNIRVSDGQLAELNSDIASFDRSQKGKSLTPELREQLTAVQDAIAKQLELKKRSPISKGDVEEIQKLLKKSNREATLTEADKKELSTVIEKAFGDVKEQQKVDDTASAEKLEKLEAVSGVQERGDIERRYHLDNKKLMRVLPEVIDALKSDAKTDGVITREEAEKFDAFIELDKGEVTHKATEEFLKLLDALDKKMTEAKVSKSNSDTDPGKEAKSVKQIVQNSFESMRNNIAKFTQKGGPLDKLMSWLRNKGASRGKAVDKDAPLDPTTRDAVTATEELEAVRDEADKLKSETSDLNTKEDLQNLRRDASKARAKMRQLERYIKNFNDHDLKNSSQIVNSLKALDTLGFTDVSVTELTKKFDAEYTNKKVVDGFYIFANADVVLRDLLTAVKGLEVNGTNGKVEPNDLDFVSKAEKRYPKLLVAFDVGKKVPGKPYELKSIDQEKLGKFRSALETLINQGTVPSFDHDNHFAGSKYITFVDTFAKRLEVLQTEACGKSLDKVESLYKNKYGTRAEEFEQKSADFRDAAKDVKQLEKRLNEVKVAIDARKAQIVKKPFKERVRFVVDWIKNLFSKKGKTLSAENEKALDKVETDSEAGKRAKVLNELQGVLKKDNTLPSALLAVAQDGS